MSEGWIKIYRNIQEHWIWQNPQKLKWWLDILLLANYKDNKFLLGNEVITIERGEHHTSELKLAERWGVSKTTVRKFLKLLEEENMIELKKSKKGTTFKVTNYNDYQDFSEEEKTIKKLQKKHKVNYKETTREPYDIQQKNYMIYTNNKEKNEKNGNNEKKEKKGKEIIPNQTPIYSMLKQSIIDTFGEVAFNTWFKPCDIEDGDELVIKAPNNFTKEILDDRFKEYLEKVVRKDVRIYKKGIGNRK
ncbi:DnaA N-terminal domain-containing protein [Clostridium botulinum]|uniref:DnaA N-terminal domain-containing protein n=1 Tax=Clostridium botulinum TaxID=1491 RepID=UPI00069B6D53|nr:DnaA N-terminal domain-containing protein [Clostridium botulinum]MCD3204030.1 GntR family transcriptional regulator [Clostridium botulinum C/D]MCD3222282.1 GntR family transcriptional regulator [Clostridium botulinum C/D]MCD3232077.1 GntR family transcriptional regulator [Clostridium botulinum C/D]MCD3273055.1 GntR family transcriptional regulator [Clostridium botulinum C/D]MCD3297775.1 GntR family transcriptional regulator [Clostridium botulinum C/D]